MCTFHFLYSSVSIASQSSSNYLWSLPSQHVHSTRRPCGTSPHPVQCIWMLCLHSKTTGSISCDSRLSLTFYFLFPVQQWEHCLLFWARFFHRFALVRSLVLSNKCNQCDFASSLAGDLRRHLKHTQWRKFKQMQPMRLCLFSCSWFKETSENTQWRKFK